MKVIVPIYHSMKRSLKGQEKLWVVFWLWGVALYVGSIAIGILVLSSGILPVWLEHFIGILSFVNVFFYPFIFCFALWQCSKNTMHKWCTYGVKFYVIFFIVLLAWWYVDWDKFYHPAYRKLANYSEEQTELFNRRLLEAMKSKSEIYIRDLVDFEWDTVCAMEGYSHLREDIALKNIYGKDILALEYFPQVREGSTNFVFLQNNKLIAVLDHSQPDLRYKFDSCAIQKKSNSQAYQI